MDTVIEAAMAGAPRGMTWHKAGDEDYELLDFTMSIRGDVKLVDGQWRGRCYDLTPAKIGEYGSADRAMVAVNLRLGPQPEREVDPDSTRIECMSQSALDEAQPAAMDRTRHAAILRTAAMILRGASGAELTAPQLAAAALNRAAGPAVDMDDVVLLLRVCLVGYLRADYALRAVNAMAALLEARTEDEIEQACRALQASGKL